ncbi:long-chain fatty aldehyde decarbonylase [Pseudomonas lini]|jgi:fatty aldehyde decarbonylase|uniref:Ferritin-like domain-containing protein n=1 Tax=Pseudomonas farris TaxID=2841207 RepID=A0ABS6PYE4_9PSED|nr:MULTISPECIES: long-chain fatty aldehyde decarbonylase [Pseudomonas]MBV4465486.1 ferritin-like domain-containing protein [Pseudomonas farris]NSX10437.1 long-chain fatty aldehyde decarbonylase [Pseudomonas lini]
MNEVSAGTQPNLRAPVDLRAVNRREELSTEHNKSDGYFNLIAYIASNAIAGEVMAVENYSEMVPLMPDTESKIETVKQAYEESKHILMLASLGKRHDYIVMREIVEPQWFNIRRHFSTAVQNKDLAACLIIQDLMTETMAIVLYRTLQRQGDPDTSALAGKILEDELEHLEIGLARIRGLIAKDPEGVHESLKWAHHRVMPELFSMVSTSCHFLCDRLNIDCGALSLGDLKTDIDEIRIEALDTYVETLDKANFDPVVTAALIESMQTYGGTPSMNAGLANA